MTLPASKAEATRLGVRFFETGKACPAGHTGPRYTRGGSCVDCTRQRNARKLGRVFSGVGVRGRVSVERAAAARRGATTFTSDRPCPLGHVERFTSNVNCVECSRLTLQRDAEKRQWARRFRLYGVDEAAYLAMRTAQAERCGICRDPLPAIDKTHIDHCHTTGRVRGLLCGRCNQALGLFREDPDIMRSAIAYVAH